MKLIENMGNDHDAIVKDWRDDIAVNVLEKNVSYLSLFSYNVRLTACRMVIIVCTSTSQLHTRILILIQCQNSKLIAVHHLTPVFCLMKNCQCRFLQLLILTHHLILTQMFRCLT